MSWWISAPHPRPCLMVVSRSGVGNPDLDMVAVRVYFAGVVAVTSLLCADVYPRGLYDSTVK
jgi:hypothetical protein